MKPLIDWTAERLLDLTAMIAPARRQEWMEAMRAELGPASAGRIPWAAGCLCTALRERMVSIAPESLALSGLGLVCLLTAAIPAWRDLLQLIAFPMGFAAINLRHQPGLLIEIMAWIASCLLLAISALTLVPVAIVRRGAVVAALVVAAIPIGWEFQRLARAAGAIFRGGGEPFSSGLSFFFNPSLLAMPSLIAMAAAFGAVLVLSREPIPRLRRMSVGLIALLCLLNAFLDFHGGLVLSLYSNQKLWGLSDVAVGATSMAAAGLLLLGRPKLLRPALVIATAAAVVGLLELGAPTAAVDYSRLGQRLIDLLSSPAPIWLLWIGAAISSRKPRLARPSPPLPRTQIAG